MQVVAPPLAARIYTVGGPPGSVLAQKLIGGPLPLIKCDHCPKKVVRHVSTTPEHPGWVFIKCLNDRSRLFAHLLALAIDGGGGPDPAPTSGTTSTIGVPCLLQVDPLHHPGAPGVVLHIVEWDPAVATATVSTSPGAAGAPPPSPDGFVTGLNTHGTDVKTQPDGRTPMLFFLLGR
uniref:Uncharacterized protein n=1 Tax=Aegilops tauschii TaxID=37682 RepID=M8B6J5_AEGTA